MRMSEQQSAVENGPVEKGLVHGFGPEPSSIERRPQRRKRVLLAGVIAYDGGKYSFDCTLRDLSEAGARVSMPKHTQFPSSFYLINIRDRVAHEASVIWCGASEAGVGFTRTIALADGLDPALGFLKRMWLARAVR
jgi:hypothetical protein